MRSIRAKPERRRARARRFSRLAWVAGAGALVSLAAVPLGCGSPLPSPIAAAHPDDATPRDGGTLRLSEMADIRSLDPAGPSDALAVEVEHLLYAGLVDFDAHGTLVPDLAEHWEIADGGRTYRFVLRQGVRFHDGAELVADDVKRSAERALRRSTPDPNASYFDGITGYDAYAGGRAEHLEGIVVEGRYRVAFHLEEADATFLSVLALPALRPVCASAGDRYVDTWTPCGAGPFELPPGGWQRGLSVRLVRHPAYFRPGLPHLDAVEWRFNMQPLSERFRFEDGDLDLFRHLSQADEVRYAADPRWRALGTPEADVATYGESMNTRLAPFDDVEVRRAVAAAIDREHYRLLKPAFVTVLNQLLPPGLPGYDAEVPGQRYDYAAALEHMRKAGYPYDPVTGRGGWPKPIVYPLFDKGLLVYTSQLLQQDLAKIGLRLELKLVSWPAMLALKQQPDGAAISQGAWAMDYPDPSSFFEPLFTSAAIAADAASNTSFYSNARLDDLVSRARHELDPRRRRALYRDANTLLCDEAPWAFAFSYHWFDLRQPYVRGPLLHPVWTVDPTTTWLDRPEGPLARRLSGAVFGDRRRAVATASGLL